METKPKPEVGGRWSIEREAFNLEQIHILERIAVGALLKRYWNESYCSSNNRATDSVRSYFSTGSRGASCTAPLQTFPGSFRVPLRGLTSARKLVRAARRLTEASV